MEKATYAMFCLCFAIFCMVIAFASPYWVESFSKANNPFVKCGLWEFCFNDYTFYKDYNGKRYIGCWYIFSDTYRPIWEWLSPPWFISVQVMISVSLLFQALMCIICTFAYWRSWFIAVQVMISVSLLFQALMCVICTFAYWRCLPTMIKEFVYIGAGLVSFFVVLLIMCSLIVLGVKKEDRGWMPRPDQNFLSFSYGLAAISGWFMLFAGCLFIVAARKDIEKAY